VSSVGAVGHFARRPSACRRHTEPLIIHAVIQMRVLMSLYVSESMNYR